MLPVRDPILLLGGFQIPLAFGIANNSDILPGNNYSRLSILGYGYCTITPPLATLQMNKLPTPYAILPVGRRLENYRRLGAIPRGENWALGGYFIMG